MKQIELEGYKSHKTEFGVYYLGDNVEMMKKFSDNYFDIAVVDPPYGIGEDGAKNHSRGAKTGFKGQKTQSLAPSKKYTPKEWDKNIPTLEYFQELKRISKYQIIWGGNYYLSLCEEESEPSQYIFGDPVYDTIPVLGATSCWIVWDKQNEGNDFADCELAWTNFKCAVRKYSYKWNGMLQKDMKNKEVRLHPTQKPIDLYRFIAEKFIIKEGKKSVKPHEGETLIKRVLDTNVGSASSIIGYITEAIYYKANFNISIEYVGMEIDEEYFGLSCQRIDNEKYGKGSVLRNDSTKELDKHGHQAGLF